MNNDLAGMAISKESLAVGQSRDLDERLSVTRMADNRYVIKEKGGDSMWLFESDAYRFTQVTDTDRNGTYDALVDVWGDPHFNTQNGLADITDEASLAAHMDTVGYVTRYDVQTDYRLESNGSDLAMKTVEAAPGFTVNDEGSLKYLGNDNRIHAFSFDYIGGADLAFKSGATDVLAGSAAPVTHLAFNGEASDRLFMVNSEGRWGPMADGTFVDTKGEVTAGDVRYTVGRDRYAAQTDFKSINDQAGAAQGAAQALFRNAAVQEEDESDMTDQANATKLLFQVDANGVSVNGIVKVSASTASGQAK